LKDVFKGTKIRNSGFDAFATLTYSASPIPGYCFLPPFDATFVNSGLAQGKAATGAATGTF
jgi:hypothetical protein